MGTESPSEVRRLMWMTVILRGVVVNVESNMVRKVLKEFNFTCDEKRKKRAIALYKLFIYVIYVSAG
jgi:hypothetical protein